MFYIDLDHFKDVNDTLGHHIGDELILNVTQRLSRIMRGNDLVARLGGDEFAIITTCASDSLFAAGDRRAHHCRGLRALLDQRPQHHHRRLDRHRGDRPPRRATPPTFCATPTWRSIAPRTKAATAPASTTRRWTPTCRNRKLLEGDLLHAIQNDDLRAAYQPIVNAAATP